jgi:DNA mismatch endonuclease (patch repair protein)
MVDTFTPEKRSEVMRAIRSRDTKPEMIVRSAAHAMGYRYRLHKSGLPGKPDLVFAGRRKIIFVHGCFWHGHTQCRGGRLPKSNNNYWQKKIARNQTRDKRVARKLRAEGWSVMTIWECEIRDLNKLRKRLLRFLGKVNRG